MFLLRLTLGVVLSLDKVKSDLKGWTEGHCGERCLNRYKRRSNGEVLFMVILVSRIIHFLEESCRVPNCFIWSTKTVSFLAMSRSV